MNVSTKLTTKQKEVLDYIKMFCAKNKYPPSVKETAQALDVSSPATIHVHIQKLIEKGYLKRSNNSSHQLQLLVNNEYEEIVKIFPKSKSTKENIPNTLYVSTIPFDIFASF